MTCILLCIFLFSRAKGGILTNYLFQFARILAFCFLGEICHAVLPLPIPASIYGLILLLAIFVITIGGFKLAVSASREFSALLGIPRSLVYSIAPISGIFIIIAQIINIYEDITGEKVDC